MDKIDELLTRGVVKIYPSKEALEKVLRSGKKLRLYQGFDPTGTQLHIGHMVGLMKLRQFQKVGHHVIFLIGDFTGMIGDPSGKYSSRKILTREQVLKNARTYKDQVSKILDFSGDNPIEIKYNSEWLGKMSAIEFLRLSNFLTYQQVVERDMFQERKKKGQDVFVNEFMYPVLQGYDSVAMNVDLEIGGSDQTFNMLMGRKLMRNILHKEKYVLTTPLLIDSTGKKIGKTEGNVIALTAKPNDFYGMIMSLPDDVIVKSFEYITELPMEEVEKIRREIKSGKNPMQYKKLLAFTLTKMLNSEEEAKKAQEEFERVFQKRLDPTAPTVKKMLHGLYSLSGLIYYSASATSKSQAKRLIEEGAVELNGVKMTDPNFNVELKVDKPFLLRVGRIFKKIVPN